MDWLEDFIGEARTEVVVLRRAFEGWRAADDRGGFHQLINFRLHLLRQIEWVLRPCDYESTDEPGMRPIDHVSRESVRALGAAMSGLRNEIPGHFLDGATTDRVKMALERVVREATDELEDIEDSDRRECIRSRLDEIEIQTAETEKSFPTFRVLVVTALGLELLAVSEFLKDAYPLRGESGLRYEAGTIPGRGMVWDARLVEMGPGNVNAAVLATQAIGECTPDMLALVGIAGSLRCDDVMPGDVVVADRVYHYEGKVEDPAPRARPVSYAWPTPISQAARAAARAHARDADTDYNIHVKPIAAGETLLKSGDSQVAEIIHQHFSDAVAIDMESVGVFAAVHSSGAVPTVIVRGISDCLEDKTPERDRQRQPIAAGNAADVLLKILRRINPQDV